MWHASMWNTKYRGPFGIVLGYDKDVIARTTKKFKRPCVVEVTFQPTSYNTDNIKLSLFGTNGFELRGIKNKHKIFEY